ncbi:MAG: hypothetical protein PHN98_12745 [Smithellaceae bacterium]|nr:hypothetical protein [Smithellaceae bacterium]
MKKNVVFLMHDLIHAHSRMIAASKPVEKEMMIKMILNWMNEKK